MKRDEKDGKQQKTMENVKKIVGKRWKMMKNAENDEKQ